MGNLIGGFIAIFNGAEVNSNAISSVRGVGTGEKVEKKENAEKHAAVGRTSDASSTRKIISTKHLEIKIKTLVLLCYYLSFYTKQSRK